MKTQLQAHVCGGCQKEAVCGKITEDCLKPTDENQKKKKKKNQSMISMSVM